MYTSSFNVKKVRLSDDERTITIWYDDADGTARSTDRPTSCFHSWLREKKKLQINNQEYPEMTVWEYFFTTPAKVVDQDVASYMDSLMESARQEQDLTSYADDI